MHASSKPAALLQLGFRPFFLGGALYAALAIPLWIAGFFGHLGGLQPAGGWLIWHQHEMLFGFGGAIVAGFLLTAVQNWTGVPGLAGRPLALLAGIWLAARLAWLLNAPLWLLIPLDLAFFPAVAISMAISLGKVKQTRNYPIVLVLALLAVANLVALIGLQQGDYSLLRQGSQGALWLVVALMSLIGGRVIPFFTSRGLGRNTQPQPIEWLDNALLVGSIVLSLLMLSGFGLKQQLWQAPLYVLLAAGHGVRLLRWHDRGLWQVPLLWSLHLAYAWLVIALLAMTCWHLGWSIGFSQATHLLAIGSMSGLILAMTARVTLGHTGRPLQPPASMSVAFLFINLAVPARVWLTSVWPQPGYWVAAICWGIAFGLFLWHYAPMLTRMRIDGRPG